MSQSVKRFDALPARAVRSQPMQTEDANRPASPKPGLWSYATLPLAIATTLFLLFIIYVFNATYLSDTRDEPLSGFFLLPPLIACVAGWSAYALAENDHPIGTRAAVAVTALADLTSFVWLLSEW
jgi:hypothetical protein